MTKAISGDLPDQLDRRSLRFTHIAVDNWRNFTRIDVPLQQRMFLVGPNAAGKSNFLDCFRFLGEVAAVGGGFEAAVKRRGGVSSIRSLAARRYPGISLSVTLGNDRSPQEWAYELSFKQDNQSRPLVAAESVRFRGKAILDRPDQLDEEDPERLRQTHLEQVNVNREFRIVSDFFSSVQYMHIVPQLVREPDRSVGKTNDPFGGDFLEQIARTPKQTREARLRRIIQALQVAVPQLQSLEMNADVRGVPHLRGKYQHWRKHGAWQSEERFSDGTLRLLGLLWAVTEGVGPLLLEEPELSLHPEVVRQIPQMFAQLQRRAGRQIIFSSHSPEILGDAGIENQEVLVLQPRREGTSANLLSSLPDADLRAAGIDLPDILRGLTSPEHASQLGLFAG
jgi:predicted ATPase